MTTTYSLQARSTYSNPSVSVEFDHILADYIGRATEIAAHAFDEVKVFDEAGHEVFYFYRDSETFPVTISFGEAIERISQYRKN